MKVLFFLTVIILLSACNVQGVKETGDAKKEQKIENNISVLKSDHVEAVSTKDYDNGVKISWIEHGEGANVKRKSVYNLDYKVTTKEGKVIDGNHLLHRDYLPFLTSFQMQTKGMDFVLEQLKVGDFVRALIPEKLSKGNKSIYITVKVLEEVKPAKTIDGVKMWLLEENKANKRKFNDKNSVTFHSIISSESNPYYYNSFQQNKPYNLKMTDKGIIPGLKKALKNCKKADRMFVYVPSSEAFGVNGLEGMVKPNEDLFYNVIVMDVLPK